MRPSSESESHNSALERAGVAVCCALAAMACALSSAGLAHADGPRRVLVIQLTGSVPDRAGLADSFTNAVSQVAAVGGAEVLDADASLEDAAALVGCVPTAPGCLDEIAESLGVREILFGHVEPAADGAVQVSLTYHQLGNTQARTFLVGAGAPADQAREVARETAALLSGEATMPSFEPEPEPAQPPTPEPPPPSVAPVNPQAPAGAIDSRPGRVRTRSWIALGAGVALSGASAVYFARARGRQSDIDDAPTDTPDDFRRLVTLEDEADSFATTGNVLLVAGSAALVTGAVMIVLDRRATRTNPAVAVVPYAGGAGVVVSLELP